MPLTGTWLLDCVCKVPSATSTVRVHAELRQAILDGALAPGERLRAEALAERFGTSRTPVREALQQLEARGPGGARSRTAARSSRAVRRRRPRSTSTRCARVLEPHAAAPRRRRGSARRALAALQRELRAGRGGSAHDVREQIALNEEFHRLIVAAAASARAWPPRCAASRGIPRAFRTRVLGDDAQRAQSLFCHRELVARPARAGDAGARRGRHAHAHPRRQALPAGRWSMTDD